MRQAIVCILLAWISLTTVAMGEPPPAGPQPATALPSPATDAKKEEARGYFEKAIALFEEEAWDAALVEFVRSRAIYPTRAATKDAALCLRKLHRYDEALDMFETLLREFPGLPPDDKSIAERAVQELASLVGRINLVGTETGASVVIDGRERGSMPVQPIRVPVGSHLIRVSKEGFAPFEAQVQVAGAQTVKVEAKLGALTQGGRLKVTEQSAKSVDVVVDGVVVGKTPWEGTLSVGDHTVLLRSEAKLGTQPAAAPVKLNQITSLTLAIEELDASMRVEPVPASASVAIDGVLVGRGVWEGRLRSGPHRVEVASEGFLPVTRNVTLSRDQRPTINTSLERDPSSPMWKAENPPRFTLEVDGAAAIAPTMGGDLAASCTGSCSRNLGVGAIVVGRGGYQLSSGLGFSVDGGYVTIGQKIANRPADVAPQGLTASHGTFDDALKLSGVMLGASAALHRGTTIPLVVRFGAGAVLGMVRDQRNGTATDSSNLATPYALSETVSVTARYLYVAPEARVGLRLGNHVEITAGVSALVLIGLGDVKWDDQRPPDIESPHVGLVYFGQLDHQQTLTGKTIVVVAPSLGARFEF